MNVNKPELADEVLRIKRVIGARRNLPAPTSKPGRVMVDGQVVVMQAPCVFLGIQMAPTPLPPIPLYNLLSDIPGHKAGTTVTRWKLESMGYSIPKDQRKLEINLLVNAERRLCA